MAKILQEVTANHPSHTESKPMLPGKTGHRRALDVCLANAPKQSAFTSAREPCATPPHAPAVALLSSNLIRLQFVIRKWMVAKN
jgi:hypothetical protein